jgi:hypothetical protein
VSRPTPEELRRRLTERLASEPQRGQTMTQVTQQAPPAPAPAAPAEPVADATSPPAVEPVTVPAAPVVEPVVAPVVVEQAVARAADPDPVVETVAETVVETVAEQPAEPFLPRVEAKPKPAPKPRPVVDTADSDAPALRAQKPVIRRNDESGRLRSHPVAEALYLDIARTKLRAKRGQKLTWDSILQQGLDLVLARPSQLESLLNEVDMLTSKARRTIAATISIDHDIGMQELLLDRPSIGSTRPRLKLEDIWCAALIAWKRSIL